MRFVVRAPRALKSRLKAARCGAVLAFGAGASFLCHAGPLPTGGTFINGNGSISSSGTTLTVTQTSERGIVDWKSFSVGSGHRVAFENGTGATLNRVTGGSPSAILGTLSATGSVYLVNPQGIVVGPTGVVSTGGRFVASTLDVDDTAFMSGGALTLSGTSKASVTNLGRIGSTNGDVFLIATGTVSNLGRISAPQGTAELATGKTVLLSDSSSGRQVFVQAGSAGTVLNGGQLAAAQANLQAADGNIFAFSGNHRAIRATGTASRDGHIWLVADTGTVSLAGTLEAKNADGSGGIVDTAARALRFDPLGLTVRAGAWNVSTPGFSLDRNAASAFSASLAAGTSIGVRTTGTDGHSGDIDVTASLDWTGPGSLALSAYRNVRVEPGVTVRNEGAGSLTLRADASAIDNGGSVLNGGTLDWSKSTGSVNLYRDSNGAYSAGTLLGNPAWAPNRGAGIVTQITAYKLVNSLADLESVSSDPAGNYALGRDIAFSGAYVDQIGSTSPFTGQFDGLGHTLDGVRIKGGWDGSDFAAAGPLFGVVGSAGVVRNLGVTNGGGRRRPLLRRFVLSRRARDGKRRAHRTRLLDRRLLLQRLRARYRLLDRGPRRPERRNDRAIVEQRHGFGRTRFHRWAGRWRPWWAGREQHRDDRAIVRDGLRDGRRLGLRGWSRRREQRHGCAIVLDGCRCGRRRLRLVRPRRRLGRAHRCRQRRRRGRLLERADIG